MKFFIISIILLAHPPAGHAIEGCRRDRDNDHRPRANCTAAGFSSVPGGIESSTQVLLFRGNLFSSLSWSSFLVFNELYEIDLASNKVPSVTVDQSLPTLSVLRLGWNQVTFLGDGSFRLCPALIKLELNNNAIRTLSDSTFSGLSRLEVLDLSYNEIETLPPALLHPLATLETLLLEYNKIRMMPSGWFKQKPDVPYLFLSANPWACSCSLGYFNIYLNDNEFNIYVRDRQTHSNEVESVVCQTPQRLQGRPVVALNEGDLCPSEADTEPTVPSTSAATTVATYAPTTAAVWLETTQRVTVETHTWGWYWSTPATVATTNVLTEETTLTAISETEDPPVSTASWVTPSVPGRADGDIEARGSARIFCFWLFAGCLMLCLSSAACVLVTLGTLVVWYRRAYQPLKASLRARGETKEAVELLAYSTYEGVTALYRSVLFVSAEGGVPPGGAEVFGSQETPMSGSTEVEGGEVYRTTVYRHFSKQQGEQAWKEVVEEHQRDEWRKRGEDERAREVARRSYSVILREEREDEGGKKQEKDWLVGGWELKSNNDAGGEDARSSWGEWLTHLLPSMPWGSATGSDVVQ